MLEDKKKLFKTADELRESVNNSNVQMTKLGEKVDHRTSKKTVGQLVEEKLAEERNNKGERVLLPNAVNEQIQKQKGVDGDDEYWI